MPDMSSSRRSGSRPRPTVAEPSLRESSSSSASARAREEDEAPPAERSSRGWLRALVVGGLTVDAVLVAASISFLVPASVGDVVFRTPLLIVVLIVGTAAILWTITRPARVD